MFCILMQLNLLEQIVTCGNWIYAMMHKFFGENILGGCCLNCSFAVFIGFGWMIHPFFFVGMKFAISENMNLL
ncbi:hypothetical protein EDD64_12036 [Effusibacillus lacus]|nr:hypothetical protein EDD64_12036 [Effusibacillus lacus]